MNLNICIEKISKYLKEIYLETRELEFTLVDNFLEELKREFGEEKNLAKVLELKIIDFTYFIFLSYFYFLLYLFF